MTQIGGQMSKAPKPINIMDSGEPPKETPPKEEPKETPQAQSVDFGPVINAIQSGFENLDKSVKGIKIELPKLEPVKTEPPKTEPPKEEPPKETKKPYRLFDEFDPTIN